MAVDDSPQLIGGALLRDLREVRRRVLGKPAISDAISDPRFLVPNRQFVQPSPGPITENFIQYWPGIVRIRSETDQTFTDLGNVWISDINGTELTPGKVYKAREAGERKMAGEATPRPVFATNVICCGGAPPSDNLPRRLQIIVLGPTTTAITPIWPFRVENALFDRVPGTRIYNWVSGTGVYERQGFPIQQLTANEMSRAYLELMTVPANLNPPFTLALRVRLPFFTFSPIGSEFGYDNFAYIREEIIQSGNLATFRFVSRRNSIGQTVTFPPSPTGPFPNFSWTNLEFVFPALGGGPNIGCWAYVIE